MEAQIIHYCFTLSEEQMKFLCTKKYKIDRMECFMALVALAARERKLVSITKTQQVEILPGQVLIDYTKLSKLWKRDRKTVPKIIEAMEKLGISSSQKIGENRIHTLHSLSGWYVDGRFRRNDFASRRIDASHNIFHIMVPPAKVLTVDVEDDTKTVKADTAVAQGNSHVSAEDTPSLGGSYSPSSPQSNDSGNESKTAEEEKTSAPSTSSGVANPSCDDYNSADVTPSQQEADDRQDSREDRLE